MTTIQTQPAYELFRNRKACDCDWDGVCVFCMSQGFSVIFGRVFYSLTINKAEKDGTAAEREYCNIELPGMFRRD